MVNPGLAIDLSDVDKRYGRRVHALRGVSLSVARGEVFGLLGPNGAGKSTLVKIIMTVVKPTRASGRVLGAPVGSKSVLGRVGYLPENHRFPRYLTGRQTLDFFASLSGADRAARRQRVPELLEIVGMSRWADQKIGMYSKGMMQRVGLAQALVGDPELVVLDEPTDGVDPVGRRDIRDLILHLREKGKTIFINSHLLSELEMVCDRVAIMVSGRVSRCGTMAELAVGRQAIEIELDTREGVLADFAPTGLVGDRLPDGTPASVRDTTLRIVTSDSVQVQPVIDQLRAAGRVIRRVQVVQPTLEQLFMEAVEEHHASAAKTPSRYTPGAEIK